MRLSGDDESVLAVICKRTCAGEMCGKDYVAKEFKRKAHQAHTRTVNEEHWQSVADVRSIKAVCNGKQLPSLE